MELKTEKIRSFIAYVCLICFIILFTYVLYFIFTKSKKEYIYTTVSYDCVITDKYDKTVWTGVYTGSSYVPIVHTYHYFELTLPDSSIKVISVSFTTYDSYEIGDIYVYTFQIKVLKE